MLGACRVEFASCSKLVVLATTFRTLGFREKVAINERTYEEIRMTT
jgi:hypothetical protein